MPLPLETEITTVQPVPVIPNSIYVPHIDITTNIYNGEIKTSAILTLKAAQVNEYGVWSEVPSNPLFSMMSDMNKVTVEIPDVDNLDPDIIALQPQIDQIFQGIIYLVYQLNATRKLL
jgi:hypothetical protein